MRNCGQCTLCCKLVAVNTLKEPKPRGIWCPHGKPGAGCAIYKKRPKECAEFWCLWLHEEIPLELSPLKTRVVAWTAQDNSLRLCEDEGFHGNAEKFFSPYIDACLKRGYKVHLFHGKKYLGFFHK